MTRYRVEIVPLYDGPLAPLMVRTTEMGTTDPRWRVIREFQSSGSDPAVVVQLVLPRPIWFRLVEALDLAARMTGSEKLGAQLDAIISEATTEWLRS